MNISFSSKINNFCVAKSIKKGNPVFNIQNSNIVTSKPCGTVLGIALYNIILTSNSTSFDVIRDGTILFHMPKRYGKIPTGQPIYFNGKNYTLKMVSPLIGHYITKDYDIYHILQLKI